MSATGSERRDPDPMHDPIRAARDEVERIGVAPAVIGGNADVEHGTIDRYELIREIGEGGMGTVWLAEQAEPVRRRVALKIIKLGMDSREIIARFEAERQALAMMDHPFVAKVLDGGTTDAGRPYFAMELVDGVPITRYCEDHRISLRERLELFAKVCDAIQHAHQKGIIHRDIKPSNVLVSVSGGEPAPKVIDFGVAKAVDTQLTQKTIFTQYGQIMGTPEYMAPEQATMSGDIDTRADVYSLGALLYELLTGTKPFELSRPGETTNYLEALQTIRDVDPPTPSTRLSSIENAVATTEARVAWPPSRLRGDLDWIVIKAMDKDRARRYESASTLADDVRRHLADQPVAASPPSRMYQLRKLARRHRVMVAATGIVAALLLVGSIGATWGWLHLRGVNQDLADAVKEKERQRLLAVKNEGRAKSESERARNESERATRELSRATEVGTLLSEMILSAEPAVAMGADTALFEQLLEEMAQRILDGEIDDLSVANELQLTVGNAYIGIQQFELAELHLSTAVQQATDAWTEADPRTLFAIHQLANLRLLQSRDQEVLNLIESRLPIFEAVFGSEHRATQRARILTSQAHSNLGDRDHAERIARSAVEVLARNYPAHSEEMVRAESALAQILLARMEFAEAGEILRRVTPLYEEHFGPDHVETLRARKRLGATLLAAGYTNEALEMMEDAVSTAERTLGPGYLHTLLAQVSLAQALAKTGDVMRCHQVLNEVVQNGTRSLGADHHVVRKALLALVTNLKDFGQLHRAKDMLENYLDAMPDDVNLDVHFVVTLLDVYANLSRFDDVDAYLEKIWPDLEAFRDRQLGDAKALHELDQQVLRSLTNVGFCFNRVGRFAKARPLLEISFPIKRRKLGCNHPWTNNAGRELAKAVEGLGDPEAAAEAWQQYYACLREMTTLEPPPDPTILNQLSWQIMRATTEPSRDPELAVALAERAAELTDNRTLPILGTLIEAHVRNDDVPAALEVYESRVRPALANEPEPVRRTFEQKIAEIRARAEQP